MTGSHAVTALEQQRQQPHNSKDFRDTRMPHGFAPPHRLSPAPCRRCPPCTALSPQIELPHNSAYIVVYLNADRPAFCCCKQAAHHRSFSNATPLLTHLAIPCNPFQMGFADRLEQARAAQEKQTGPITATEGNKMILNALTHAVETNLLQKIYAPSKIASQARALSQILDFDPFCEKYGIAPLIAADLLQVSRLFFLQIFNISSSSCMLFPFRFSCPFTMLYCLLMTAAACLKARNGEIYKRSLNKLLK